MKKPKPFFSVIIPTFNRANFLKRSILSVLNQTMQDFELIVVDDGSTDESSEILTELQNIRSFIVIEQLNNGVSSARNAGAKIASGDFLAFLDSDDEWLPQKLELQYNYLQENPSCKIVHSNEEWIRNSKKINQKRHHQRGGGDQFQASCQNLVISPSTVAIHHRVFLEVGGFDELYPVCEDYDLFLRLTNKYELGFIPEILTIKYAGHANQLSVSFVAMDYWRVKSLIKIIISGNLDIHQKKIATVIAIKKCEILLNGYIKHQNLEHLQEVSSFLKILLMETH